MYIILRFLYITFLFMTPHSNVSSLERERKSLLQPPRVIMKSQLKHGTEARPAAEAQQRKMKAKWKEGEERIEEGCESGGTSRVAPTS